MVSDDAKKKMSFMRKRKAIAKKILDLIAEYADCTHPKHRINAYRAENITNQMSQLNRAIWKAIQIHKRRRIKESGRRLTRVERADANPQNILKRTKYIELIGG